MKHENKELKTFNIRMPFETWLFLKQQSAAQQTSMAEIILSCVNKYKKNIEKN
jgi:hypothetical protein